ncbi:hypothetical protein CLU79DRAFT_54642 [Phycomyces nitens]|nr:hypothetical protein CLU79DRAFT_54642 [Phycomyces nitens]
MYVVQPTQQKQDGSAGPSMLSMAPSSAGYSPEVDSPATTPGGGEKRPKLRVQIPESAEDAAGCKPAEQHQPNMPTRLAMHSQVPASARGLPSAVPSQFAQNLPSPSTFYPEFYQQNELPSPLNFSATPTTTNPGTFNWPPIARDYRPSPLVKVETSSGPQKRHDSQSHNEDPSKRIKLEAS